MLGNFHDNVINIECETNSADLYVVDAEGVYIENIALHSYLESDVIDAINAKYGTNFTHLTMQKVTGIAIGDDCPNWNAYEKIEMSSIHVAIHMANEMSPMVFGKLKGDTVSLACQNASEAYLAMGQGQIINGSVDITNPTDINTITSKIQSQYPDVTNLGSFLETYNVGDFVSDWEDYIIIT